MLGLKNKTRIGAVLKGVTLLTLFFCLVTSFAFGAVDTTPPTGSILINNNALKTNSTQVTLNLSASDASGIAEMQFSNDNTAWSPLETYKTTKTWVSLTGDGTKTVYVQYKDKAGNSKSYSDTIVLDTTGPAISNVGSSNITSSSANISWNTDEPATTQVEYGLTTSYGLKSGLSGAKSIAISGLKPYTLYHYRVISKDALGNQSLSQDYTFTTKDSTLPTGTIKINNNAASTNSPNVTLNLSATDTGSGLAEMQFSNDNKTWFAPEPYATAKAWILSPGSGTKTVYTKFKDNSGNWSALCSDSIILDTTPPTGTILINNNAAKTNLLTVTLNLSASDASGIAEMQFSNDNTAWSPLETYKTTKTWVLLTGDGTKIVYVKYKDNAGNRSNIYYDTIILDTTPPAISNVRTTNITATTASILWDTDTAGTSQVEYGLTSSYGLKSAYLAQLVTQHSVPLGGLKQYTVYHFRVISRDDIGNTSVSQDYALITKDVTPPQGTIAINNNAPYTNSPKVTLNFTMQDTGSGIKEMQFSADNKTWTAFEQFNSQKSWVLTAGDGTKTAYARFKDNAGNLSVIYSDSIILDTTLPTGSISINNNAAKTATVAVTLNLSAKDASGLTQMQFSNDNANWSDPEKYASTKTWTLLPLNGLKTVYARFKDNAGNWSAIYSDSITFYQPAPAAPTIDKVISPTNQNFQVISGKKSSDTTEIIVTCATASPEPAKIINNTSWICTIKDLKEGASTISVKARNAGGLESGSVTTSIVLDTQGPSIDVTSPKQGEVVK